MKTILIASSKKWFLKNKEFLKFIKKRKIVTISDKKKLNIKDLNKIKPRIIFFPHWSFKVNKNIIEKFNCICFHTSPLPYGRGGSPIQNLILKKSKEVTCIKIIIFSNLRSRNIFCVTCMNYPVKRVVIAYTLLV